MSPTAIAVMLSLLLVTLLSSPTTSLSLYNVSSSDLTTFPSTPFSVPSSPFTSPSTSPLLSLLGDPLSVTSFSGCPVQSGPYARECNFSAPITISGSGFVAPSTVTIEGRINCSATTRSSTTLLFPPTCFYWPPDTVLTAQVTSNSSSSVFPGAVSFRNTVPTVTTVIGCGASSPCYIGGPSTWTLSVRGSNFFVPFSGTLSLLLWANARGGILSSSFDRLSPTQWVARMPAVSRTEWINYFGYDLTTATPLPVSVLAQQTWGGQPFDVVSTPWSSVYLYTQTPSSSSSTSAPRRVSSSSTSSVAPQPPSVTRVSGCCDNRLMNTEECPFEWEGLELTVWGSGFTQPSMPKELTFNNQSYSCAIKTLGADMLTCLMGPVPPQPQPLLLALNFSTNLGRVLRPNALSFSSNVTAPQVLAVSGCEENGSPATLNCQQSSTLTIRGVYFPRYVDHRYIYLQLQDQLSVPCVWRQNDMTSLPELACSLTQVNLEPIYQGPSKYVRLNLRFSAPGQPERISPDVELLTLKLTPQPPTSTGSPHTEQALDDDLDSMKIALMALMVVSLSILTIATAVWGVTWWSAQRRAYVSRNGAAAVDMRQVLLH